MHTTLRDQPKTLACDSVAALDAFEAPFLEKAVLRGDIPILTESYDVLFKELKRFLYTGAACRSPIPMLHREIDELWHKFILFTREYRQFCNHFFGRYIDHSPSDGQTPLDPEMIILFEQQYTLHFGPLPTIWKQAVVQAESKQCRDCNNCRD